MGRKDAFYINFNLFNFFYFRLRKLFKHFFKDRDCCTLVRPLEKEEDLRKLNDLDDEEFRPEFTKQITVLKKKIKKKVQIYSIKFYGFLIDQSEDFEWKNFQWRNACGTNESLY